MATPVLVLNAGTRRESGRKAQFGNITAAKTVADIIRTALGPKSMLKMILSASGSIVLTNDGNAILREIEVSHPAAKSMLELSRAQDEEVGDGTTTVIILAGEMLAAAEPWLERNTHPRVIINGYTRALDDALKHLEAIAVTVDASDKQEMMNVIQSCLGTKWVARYMDQMVRIAYDSVRYVCIDSADKRREIDIKRYVRVEKIPGGEIEDSSVFPGVILNKDVIDANMRRKIENPRVILLDGTLEYKKSESQTTVEAMTPEQYQQVLLEEELFIKRQCDEILKHKPDLVVCEKGISDLAQHYFKVNGVTALRRLKRTENNRIARTVGATIVQRPEEIKESDVGKDCSLFEIKKIGDEFFAFIQGKNPKACTIILRGASKDVLNEVERNLQDAMAVARNVMLDPRLVPGGGASEMSCAVHLAEKSKTIAGVEQWPYHAAGLAMEVIPRTLIQNCGADAVRVLTQLRAKHAGGQNSSWGVDGNSGQLVDMKSPYPSFPHVWEPFSVKAQTVKTAIEAACMLLKVDDIVSGMSGKQRDAGIQEEKMDPADMAQE